jgi:hypothetical protein
LTITPNSTNTTIASAVATYTWANNGQTYTTSGVYTGTTANCVTQVLNLTILPEYKVLSASTICNETLYQVPVATSSPYSVNDVKGYDVVINYDATKLVPTGNVTITNELINSTYVESSSSIASPGVLNLTINLNGSEFQVNRSTMPDEIADQIAAVMFDANVPFETKMDFYSQFIPEDGVTMLAYTMRKHQIIPDIANKTFRIMFYDRVGDKSGFVTEPTKDFKISDSSLKKATPEQLENGRIEFAKVLMTGRANGKGNVFIRQFSIIYPKTSYCQAAGSLQTYRR